MDRRAKERLIGAAVLVVLAVVVVPELLSGPMPEARRDTGRPGAPAVELPFPGGAAEPVRNVTVDLSMSKPADLAATATQAPPPPTPVPTSAASPVTPLATQPTAPATTEGLLERAAPAPTSTASFALQLGSFANRGNADTLVHQLKAQGYAVYVSTEGGGRAARYRVRVGPLNDRDAAQRTIRKLQAQGHASTLIAPR